MSVYIQRDLVKDICQGDAVIPLNGRGTDRRLSIDRSRLSFKRTYALRAGRERYHPRFKASGQERLWVRNANGAATLSTLAHICAAYLLYQVRRFAHR